MRALPLLALLLVGCAPHVPEPKIVTREVRVPIPVTCVPEELPPPPDYARAAPDAPLDELARAAAIGLAQRDARLALLEPVVEACRVTDR